MADIPVAVCRYNPSTLFPDLNYWVPGSRLTDPDGNPLGGVSGAGVGYADDGNLWEFVPVTMIEAVQYLAAEFRNHDGSRITPIAALNDGPVYWDEDYSWTVVPQYILDAVRSLADALYNHLGYVIPCSSSGQDDIPYTGDGTIWSSIPVTITEAIQCIAAELNNHVGYRISAHLNIYAEFTDELSVWANVPTSSIESCRLLAKVIYDHVAVPLPNLSGEHLYGAPFFGDPTIWQSGIIPPTIPGAVESLANILYLHFSIPIACPGTSRDGLRYNGDPTFWTNKPGTINEAIRSIAFAISTHISDEIPSDLTYVDAPATPTSTGKAGQWAFDGLYMYKCVRTDEWIRWAVATTW